MLLLPDRTGYIGEFEIVDDHRAGKIVVEVSHRLGPVAGCRLFCLVLREHLLLEGVVNEDSTRGAQKVP